MTHNITIIGGGLAGSEAAWQAATRGISVTLYEMRDGTKSTDAHTTTTLAELVCSNSFRNDEITSAIGLLHEELRRAGSLIMQAADAHKVPAGSALGIDRDGFSAAVEKALAEHPNITIKREEIKEIPKAEEGPTIIATGPLTSSALTQSIEALTGKERLAFFDAIAPIIYKDSINFDIAWFQSRYDKAGPGGTGKDYINCPMNEEQYHNFIEALLTSDRVSFKEWEKNTPYFNACLPIEVMAERGPKTLRFGPMKPVGLTNPHAPDKKPYAVVQLRQDNKLGTLYNIVGFQTKMTYGAQKEIFRTIPGLEDAEFARLGGLHRNSFIHSPSLLNTRLQCHQAPHIRFAGQITGVEGYVESATMGLLAGRFAAEDLHGTASPLPPKETAFGALLAHITGDANPETFQPMNVNHGLFPPLEKRYGKKDRKQAYADRALIAFDRWLEEAHAHV